jgi:hypothetical protein
MSNRVAIGGKTFVSYNVNESTKSTFHNTLRDLGSFQSREILIKGSPVEFVKELLAARNTSKEQIQNRLERLVLEEMTRFTPKAGERARGQMFWRNALGYFNGLNKPKEVASVKA